METKKENPVKKAETKKQVSESELQEMLKNISMDAVIKKTAKNRNIWKPEILVNFGKTEKSARRKLRALQLDYSKAVIREAKLNNVESLKINVQNLKKFYTENLVSLDVYSNVSEETSPEKYKVIHTAFKIMNK